MFRSTKLTQKKTGTNNLGNMSSLSLNQNVGVQTFQFRTTIGSQYFLVTRIFFQKVQTLRGQPARKHIKNIPDTSRPSSTAQMDRITHTTNNKAKNAAKQAKRRRPSPKLTQIDP